MQRRRTGLRLQGRTIMFGCVVPPRRLGCMAPRRVAHTALLLDLDGISKYHAPVRARGRVGALWGQHFAASATRRIPLNPQPTFRCRERRPLLSKWSAFDSARVLVKLTDNGRRIDCFRR